jgi:hypothetical protein
MTNKLVKSLIFTLVLCLVVVKNAFAAYIDPNTGGMLFQILAVLFGVISGIFLLFSGQVKRLFFRAVRYFRKSKPEAESEPESESVDAS